MADGARKVLRRALSLTGIDRLASHRLDDHLFAIGYHSISPERRSRWHHTFAPLSIDRHRFAEQLAFLVDRGHSFISSSAITGPLPPKPTLLFFDDGFRDVLTEALPLLKTFGAAATLFVSIALVDRTDVLWSMKARQGALSEREIRTLKRRPARDRESAVAGVSLSPRELEVFLDWDDLRAIAKEGFEIGAHGVSHRPLTECAPEEVEREIQESAARIERELGIRPRSFSYPHGRYDGRIVETVRRAGFQTAIGGRTGLNPKAALPGRRLFLSKIAPSPQDSLRDFSARLYLEGALR